MTPLNPASIAKQYHSVQFSVKGFAGIYQFKIRCDSDQCLCILVREDSNLMQCLQEGDVMRMGYCPQADATTTDHYHTRIERIEAASEGRYRDHHRIHLCVLEKAS